MGKLTYLILMSLDGYIADENGNFDWAAPDEEVHSFVNDLTRNDGTYLLGRRMYEVMTFWETLPNAHGLPKAALEFAEIWHDADKVVYSTTLQEASTARTRIEQRFDAEQVRRMKATAERDLSIGGPTLAAHAFKAGLVDEVHLFVTPVLVGGGMPALPPRTRLDLTLLDEKRFGNGMVYLHYQTKA